MKTLKTYLEEEGISKDQFDGLNAEEKAGIFNKLNDQNAKAFKKMQEDVNANKEEISKALDTHREQVATQTQVLFEAIKEQGLAIKDVLDNSNVQIKKVTLKSEIASNKEALKNVTAGTQKEVVLKADVTRASVENNEQAVELDSVGQLAYGEMRAYDLFPKLPVSGSNHNGTIRYYDWDEATKVRAAGMVAEGAVFPESEAAWAKYTVELRKIGDTLPVTEEFFEDEQMFANELAMFLRLNVELERNNQIINGDGTGQNLDGLSTVCPTYVPAAAGIADASIYDLIVKLKEGIETDQDGKYTTNFALMNISDVNKMKLKKDANNNYIMPPFADRAGNIIDGIRVVVDNKVAANTMFIGDARFGRIYEQSGIVLSRGYVDKQFVEDMETLKVRQRLLFLVRNVDRTGFLQVSDIDAAVTTLAS